MKEYKRLPFLMRNVRRGFELKCRAAGIRTDPKERPSARVEVLYRYCLDDDNDSDTPSEDDDERFEDKLGSMSQWLCPICQIHGEFNTREMLSFHLADSHRDVQVSWKESMVNDVRLQYLRNSA